MLHVSDPLIKLSLLTFMSKHKSCLLIFCFLGTLLDLSLTLIEVFSFLLKFCLEIKYLLVSISLDCVQFFLQAFCIFFLFLPLFREIYTRSLSISDRKLKLLIQEFLVLFKLRNFLCQLNPVLVWAFFLFLKSLICFLLHMGHLLLERLLCAWVLIVEHLSLLLESLL